MRGRQAEGGGRLCQLPLKADAKARLKGLPPDYARCAQSFTRKFGAAEDKAGPGVCATEDDLAAIADAVVAGTTELAEQLAAPDPGCPAGYREREPFDVIQDYLAAYAAGDWEALACCYHPAAYVIDDQGILLGRTEIIDWHMSYRNAFGDFDISQDDYFRDTARLLWELDGGWVVISDGTDTFTIEGGQIRKQTRHGIIEFTGPPPES